MTNKLIYDNPRIDALSYKVINEVEGHKNDTIDFYIKGILHEFVHVCHAKLIGGYDSLTWYKEALATLLSHQYYDKEVYLDASLDELLNGNTDYHNYYVMGKYLMENYDKEYMLELAKNKNLLNDESSKIYEEAIIIYERPKDL